MTRYLLNKPLAVYLIFLIAVVWGSFCFFRIPVSLLPNIEKPTILIKINYPNNSASSLESSATKIIREGVSTVGAIIDVESESFNHFALLTIQYAFGANMSDEFIKVNERIDQLLTDLPNDLPRPQVIRQNVSDVPIVNLQIIPNDEIDIVESSEIARQLIKRRIEKIEGVSLVDINGLKNRSIRIILDKIKLRNLDLDEQNVREIIQSTGAGSGALSVKDGNYSYLVKMVNEVNGIKEIKAIPIRLENNKIISLNDIARVHHVADQEVGKHLYNNKEAIVLAIHKQPDARMNVVIEKIKEEVDLLNNEYTKLKFELTQDQTFLLNAGIENLTQDLLYGGVLCVLLLFLFVNNISSPILMGISIPISLLLTFICFYYFNISFNIISLSGLALGIGMLIDNSIVVIDSISRNYRNYGLRDSCINGVSEVFVPVLSQVLSTIVIYGPLIYLSGIAGELIYDQAIALTISLFVSLFVAFILTPVLFYTFNKSPVTKQSLKKKEDTAIFKKLIEFYDKLYNLVFRNRRKVFWSIVLLIPASLFISFLIPIKLMPRFEEHETALKIDWNEPIGIQENLRRIKALGNVLEPVIHWESDLGVSDFLIDVKKRNINGSELYYRCKNSKEKDIMDNKIDHYLKEIYPKAIVNLTGAQNAFTHLFDDSNPELEVRIRYNETQNFSPNIHEIIGLIKNTFPALNWREATNLSTTKAVSLHLNDLRLSAYSLERKDVLNQLRSIFNDNEKLSFTNNAEVLNSRILDTASLDEKITKSFLKNPNGGIFLLKDFVAYSFTNEVQSIVADKEGYYNSLYINEISKGTRIQDTEKQLTDLFEKNNINGSITGSFKAKNKVMADLIVVVLLSLVLLFAMLAIQFNNLIHPFVVMSSLPCALFGSFFTLWIAGGNFDVMAGIGLVVVLGIIVDDPTLKVETINRIIKDREDNGVKINNQNLISIIHDAGRICLKPLIMVSLTTTLALIPVYFSHGIGNDIQRNFVSVVVGGLSLGTILSFCFIPLVYYGITKKRP